MRVPDLLAAVSTSAMRLPAIALNIVDMLQVPTGPLDMLASLLCWLAGVDVFCRPQRPACAHLPLEADLI